MAQLSEKTILVDHKVKDKGFLIRICGKYGIKKWRNIYDADYNKAFRKKSPNPDLIYPGSVFRVPNKKTVLKQIKGDIAEKKKHVVEMEKGINNINKGRKKTVDTTLKQLKKREGDYQTIKILEAVTMIFVPIAGTVVAGVKGATMTTAQLARWGAGYLTLLNINTAKLVSKSSQLEETAFAKVMRNASDWTTPSYWLVSALSDEGMDHNDFKKKAAEQIKKLDNQKDQMIVSLTDHIQSNKAAIKSMELGVKQLEKL